MLALLGNLLVEISLPRLALAWLLLLVVPGLLLGAAPIAASAWVAALSVKLSTAIAGFWSVLLLVAMVAAGWFGWRPLFRTAERSFWSLNALIVQPLYTAFREGLRHAAEAALTADALPASRARLRAACAGVSGALVSLLAVLVLLWVWPHTHMVSGVPDVGSARQLLAVVLSNSVALVAAYLAVAALIWAAADVTMPQPRDLPGFAPGSGQGRAWRVAHLSDIHMVGEQYGFRIESGRAGPQGNGRFDQVLDQLAELHAASPLHLVLITGDMTDAGRSAEWAEFADAMARHPGLAAICLMLPGNHDVNIVDRANPARLDLPTSPNPRLREIRALCAMADLQGSRVLVTGPSGLAGTLSDALAPHMADMARFATAGRPRLTRALPELWAQVFPMVLPPAEADGLGMILLNSNATTHFSFTNALGMISADQARGIDVAMQAYPGAVWIIALHHHVLEYPRRAKALSERIGTALINGNWFVRRLLPYTGRAVIMHGHRHIDWIGECAGLPIVSAPSPVMEATNGESTSFYIHTLAVDDAGAIRLLAPERIEAGPGAFGTLRTGFGRQALYGGAVRP